MSTNRRDFLKKLELAGAGASLMPIISFASGSNEKISGTNEQKSTEKFTVSILQTTDVHCQIHPQDELFWENKKAVLRKTGGYALLTTYQKQEKAKAPHNCISACFQ